MEASDASTWDTLWRMIAIVAGGSEGLMPFDAKKLEIASVCAMPRTVSPLSPPP